MPSADGGLTVIGHADSDTIHELSAAVGRNLRRIRTRQGLSLERLAKVTGVSRAMLGQIENVKSTPTIALLWKIATALNVPFSAFIGACLAGFLLRRQPSMRATSVVGGSNDFG